MASADLWRLAGAFLLILANGFFVASEFAIVKVRSTRLQELAEAGSSRAKTALRVVKRLDVFLSTTQLGITLASLALGWVGEPVVEGIVEPAFAKLGAWEHAAAHVVATVIAFTAITYLHTVLGELVPKYLAIAKAESAALWISAPFLVFSWVVYPFIVVLRGSANGVIRMLGLPAGAIHEGAHSEEELRLIFEASARGGTLSESTKDLLTNVVDYTERVAREVMTPRNRMEILDARRSWDDIVKHAIAGEWTRYPLVDGERGKIIGFVHIKDLFKAGVDPSSKKDVRALARQPLIVPESMPLDKLRRRIQQTRTQMALVVDEFGTMIGLVTLEDLLEEIVGEIQDETDQESPPIIRDDAGAAEVDGGLLLDEVKDEIGLEIPEEERDGVDTVGGFVFARLARPPVVGDVVEVGRFRLVVTGVDGLRVARLRITELPPPPDESGEEKPAED
jgi:CBS domain containing-hemolysin-like protein